MIRLLIGYDYTAKIYTCKCVHRCIQIKHEELSFLISSNSYSLRIYFFSPNIILKHKISNIINNDKIIIIIMLLITMVIIKEQ